MNVIKKHSIFFFFTCILSLLICSCKTPPKKEKPVRKGHSRWGGWWQSKVSASASGRLVIRLPHPLPKDKAFTAGIYIYYRKQGRSIKGRSSLVKVRGILKRGRFDISYKTEKGKLPMVLRLKGIIRKDQRVIRYKAIPNKDITQFSGKYIWRNPFDVGTFTVEKEEVIEN